MSRWTHIAACIYLETNIRSKYIKDVIEQELIKAPKITGSEGPADIFVNPLSGHNLYTSIDCLHCPHNDKLVNILHGEIICEHPDDFTCPEGEYQTSVCISIIGNLRDRDRKRTRKEYDNFIKWLKSVKEFDDIRIRSCTIR